MPIYVNCPGCSAGLSAPDGSGGRSVRCPKCERMFTIQTDDEEATALIQGGSAGPEPRVDGPPTQPSQQQPARRPAGAGAPGQGMQLALGAASLGLAIVGASIAWIPGIGVIGWPMCAVGVILGVTALIVALMREAGSVLPLIGSSVSVLALGLALYSVMAPPSTADVPLPIAKIPPGINFPKGGGNPVLNGPPTVPTGALTLVGGQGEITAELTPQDPRDRIRPGPCKVYTVDLAQGRTYQIDHMGAPNFDAYLRLEDPEGNHLMGDDDAGGNLNSRIVYNCPRAGRYRIIATTFGAGTGRFTLRVQER
ncbi:MAG: hypothetical protein L0Z62_09275 [Gemmataceae bacterium]|nr:hypothetical protein [Gemmataceae bacterium]